MDAIVVSARTGIAGIFGIIDVVDIFVDVVESQPPQLSHVVETLANLFLAIRRRWPERPMSAPR